MEKKMMEFEVNEVKCRAYVSYYDVNDFMGTPKLLPAVMIDNGDPDECEVASVSFGEFIGQIFTTYMDTNNYEALVTELEKANVIKRHPAGFTKRSGFCTYPLYIVNPSLFDLENERDHEYIIGYNFTQSEEFEAGLSDMLKESIEAYNNL